MITNENIQKFKSWGLVLTPVHKTKKRRSASYYPPNRRSHSCSVGLVTGTRASFYPVHQLSIN